MSRYYIQENLLTARQPTVVRNEEGETIFLMVGKWGSRGDVLSLYTFEGELVANVQQISRGTGIGSLFHIYYHFKKVGSLRRVFSFQKDFYFIPQLSWVVVGDIPKHEYNIYSLQKKIMSMEKTYHAKGSFYELDVPQDEYAPICICIAAVLDYWSIDRKKEHKFFKQQSPQRNLGF
ncbi:LURP-one-related/scramblase family protein [Vagococcus elongatus]|uniref:LURP-one-related/scramblase family protein n=1 Tax=Vagococcus elongatus TaxID=180344 RepID=UPI001B86DC9A|nr:hypothetical protein [Vagococcus elongatus]